jgi:uncharacterized protein
LTSAMSWLDRDVPALPAAVRSFLQQNHVVGLATVAAGEPWAASCFYAFDAPSASLVVLSSETSRHGVAMLGNGVVAGTVAGQPKSIAAVRGVQFVAATRLLKGSAYDQAYAFYCMRHPIARLRTSSAWLLALRELKYTDNAELFASKTHWRAESA